MGIPHKIEIPHRNLMLLPLSLHQTSSQTTMSSNITTESLEKQIAVVVEKKLKKIASLNDEHSKKIAFMNEELSKKISSVEISHDQEIAELKKKLNVLQEIEMHKKKIASLEASIATSKADSISIPSYWSVSDAHSWLSKKKDAPPNALVEEAIASSSYGAFITTTLGSEESSNCEIQLPDGTKVVVSKQRWNAARKMKINDIVFLADHQKNELWRGKIEEIRGPFRSELGKDSFGQRAHFRRMKQGIDVSDARIIKGEEIELNLSVKWEKVSSSLTEPMKNFLKTHQRSTVRPLPGPPSF
jgi:hypothetical protein